jgi:hypothetical protein
LQYVPPHPCQCYIAEKLNGFLALAAARQEETYDPAAPPVLVPGTAGADRRPAAEAAGTAEAEAADPDQDWPAYRHDGARSGSLQGSLPDQLQELWRVSLGTRVTPPIAVGRWVFVASTEAHRIVCLDAARGTRVWDFTAGGRVDSPPAYHQGHVYFGSTDGWVYCLRAADGHLAWRFRGGPAERLVSVDGQLESAWPVHGSVLIQNETVYFTAGRSSHLDGGLRLFGLAADTGQVRCQTLLAGPRYTVDNLAENFRPAEGALPDILVGDGQHVFLRGQGFSADLQPVKEQPLLDVPGGFLDDSYFKRVPWSYGSRQTYGRLLVHNEQLVCVVRMFDSLRGLDPTVFFTPGDKGYLLFANPLESRQSQWSQRVPVRVRAMLLAGDRLLTAGPPDAIDPQDPLGAFEGRLGGILDVYDAASGQRLAQQRLPSPPVFNGIAAARGRLLLVSENGDLACYGNP